MSETLVESVTLSHLEEELSNAIHSIGGDTTGISIEDIPEYIQDNLIVNSWDINNGPGIEVVKEEGNYSISSNSTGLLVNSVGSLSAGDTIQNALELLQNRISNSAGIQSGRIIRTTNDGKDVDYPEITDLLENTMYLRLVSENGKVLHISAYEIDRALDTVARLNMDKADKSTVDALSAALDGKASAIRLELFESDIDKKADKTTVETLTETVEGKADKTVVDTLSETVEGKADKTVVDTLANTIESKANIAVVTKLQEDVKALHNTLNSLSDSATIAAIQNQINYLNFEIQRRLTIDDLSSLQTANNLLSTKVEDNTSKISSLETNLTNKASVAYVQRNINELNTVITNVAAKVNNKAEKSEIASKASQEDLNILARRINNLDASTTETLETVNTNYSKLQEDLSKKASKTSVETLSSNITASLNSKLDKSTFTETVNNLTDKIDAIDIETPLKEVDESLHNIQTSFNNSLSSVQNVINTHDRKLLKHDEQIAKMQELDSKLEIATANEWVRVMTPEEYNRLSNQPNYSDGTKNPYAKQPNTLYMLVRYNKPVAVYIGTVLIAEAKQDGSVGFAYEFPIIF